MKTKIQTFLAALTIIAAGTPARADFLLESFETSGSLYGPGTASPIVAGSVAQSTSFGVTEGLYSMQAGLAPGAAWAWQLGKTYGAQAYTEWYNHKKLAIDVFRAPGANGWNFDFNAAMNGAMNWQQTSWAPSWQWLNAGDSSSFTYVWDYSAIRNAAPAPGSPNTHWWQINLLPRSGQGGTVYIDNIRFIEVVPEPGSITLIGLGLGALAMARRKKSCK